MSWPLSFLIGLLAGEVISASYAPTSVTCPSGQALVRAANGLSDNEESYRVGRKAVADVSLKAWLEKTNPGFGTDNLPTIALTHSGGGYRSLLCSAGVVQGLDGRDSNVSTSGLYQAITYQSGLSGGSWFVSSLAASNYATVSYLRDNLWESAFQNSLFAPDGLEFVVAYAKIVGDLEEKEKAGFHTTLTDPWGRLLAYQLIENDGESTTFSSVATFSNFAAHAVPFPIVTSLGVRTFDGQCLPATNATTYEFSPYEFGSWDADVSAFTPTEYLGTTLENGVPTGTCTKNYDNLGYILGTSSSLFNEVCLSVPTPVNGSSDASQDIAAFLDGVHEVTTKDLYATYKNPFYGYASSTGKINSVDDIPAQENLSLVDGGEAKQNNPIFPFLQPARNISAIIVNDNSADTSSDWPSGIEIYTTYQQALAHGLTRMPVIPPSDTFIAQGYNARATFFGCGDATKITIIYLPNAEFSYASNVPTAQLIYPKSTTAGVIANGVEVASQGNDEDWPTCLGCAFMEKTGQVLPSECTACFTKYCYTS
ncbi:256de11b-f485-4b5e-a351-179bd70b34f3 [Sclerotinia trifoliorum]|uniref:Lysophospholipase n=1 Tax=Sclerotinia trifoliorum TaxID=28548 RepID=A0A8H2ZTD1_9HELO|nr:256de11b-f485-4b5e-a351-179bd70b34f3 [Sclerotinia trifoliorum]